MSNQFSNDFFIPPPPGTGPRNDVRALTEMGTAKAAVEQMIHDMSFVRVENVAVYRCTCQRCPKVWHTFQVNRPKACPGCKSAYWDRAKTMNTSPPADGTANGFGKGKKRKKSVKGGKVGRPRKNAVQTMEPAGGDASPAAEERELPAIPLAVLGAMGGLAIAPGEGLGAGPEVYEEEFPVATPFNTRTPDPIASESLADTVVETRQPVDDRGCEIPAGERMPPLPDPDWWR